MAGITLTGQNPNQPFDIQTQQAQLARDQELALALLKQSMSPDSAIVHTGGGNPFARDVVNLAPIGKLAQALFANQHLHGEGGIDERQQSLANQLLQRYQEGIGQMFSPSMPGGAPSVMGTEQPTMRESAQRGLMNQDPRIQALGNSLLQAIAKGEEARQVTPAAIASQIRARVDPASMRFTKGVFEYPLQTQADVNAMKLLPEIEKVGPSEQLVNVPRGENAATGVPGGTPAIANPAGVIVPPNPKVPAQEADLKAQVELARLDQQNLHNFITEDMTKYVDLIKLAQIAQTQGTTGSFGDQINEARKIAARIFGFSSDDANKITNFETMMKMALTPAAHAGRKEVGGRYTQLEFMQFLKAGAASGATDPRTAQNIFTDGLLNGFTAIENHRGNTIPTLSSTPGGEGFGSSLLTGIPSSQELADKMIPRLEAPKGAQPVHVTYDPALHTWHNEFRADAQPPVGATATKQSLPAGYTLLP